MTVDKYYHLLERELAVDDPWRLDGSPFERLRYAEMLRMSRSAGDIASALEVGCAAGAFTEKLIPHCRRLTVVDVMPQAIARARARQRNEAWSHVTWTTCDIRQFSTAERFDLIVVAEVLYYLEDVAEMRAAIRSLVGMLAPNGSLVFGSARDALCRRWGHAAGAETVIAIFKESLVEVERLHCQAESANEDCLLVLFRSPDQLPQQSNRGQ